MNDLSRATFFDLGLQLWRHVGANRKKQFLIQITLGLLVSVTEIISIGTILPFLALLAEPSKFLQNPGVANILGLIGLEASPNLIYLFTAIFIATSIMAMGMRLLMISTNSRLASGLGSDLSSHIYRKTLYQPYIIHIDRNGGSVISGILLKLNAVIYGVITPFLNLATSLIMLLVVILVLSLISPYVTLLALLLLAGIYASVMGFVKSRLRKNSYLVAKESTKALKILQESLGGIRDVIVDGAQEVFAVAYRETDFKLRRAEAQGTMISQGPRYVIETILVCLITLVAFWFAVGSQNFVLVVPVLGACALGAQRLLPVLQQSYASWVSIQNNRGHLLDVLELLSQDTRIGLFFDEGNPIQFNKSIKLKKIFFRYKPSNDFVLREVSLEIEKGSLVGIIGLSGSGKSTLIDILMGLLEPEKGELLVDELKVDFDKSSLWQKRIAHVPQSIYLSDASISQNIAFGVPEDLIDIERVKWAASKAQLDFVIDGMPEGYETLVGERGVRLSGGQRQRIGIARALYKKVEVVIFDEATSALDNETESAVMQTIFNLNLNLTIIIIAHRLTTLIGCNKIIELDNGQVMSSGSYDEVIAPKLNLLLNR